MSSCKEGAVGANKCPRSYGYDASIEERAIEVDIYTFTKSKK
jgi:hypothetical protein